MIQKSTAGPAGEASSIAAVYRATLKRKDLAFNVYVCRPLAAVFVYALRNTRIAPNQVTFFSLFLTAVAATVLLFVKWPLGLWVGVGIYELSYVFDKVDGMLARLRSVQSQTGHLLDFLMDEIKAFVVLATMSAAAFVHGGDVSLVLWGLGGLTCLASGIGMTTFVRRPEVVAAPSAKRSAGSAHAPGERGSGPAVAPESPGLVPRLVGLAEGVGRLFVHYPSYIWLAAVLGDVRYYLYPYAVTNALYAARSLLGLMLRYGRFAPRAIG